MQIKKVWKFDETRPQKFERDSRKKKLCASETLRERNALLK